MSASDVALIIATVASPVVAIYVSRQGNQTARETADRAADTARAATQSAKETADADRALERYRFEVEASKDQTAFVLGEQRKIYLKVLEIVGTMESRPDSTLTGDAWVKQQKECYYRLSGCRPNVRLFGAPQLATEIDALLGCYHAYDATKTRAAERRAWHTIETQIEHMTELMRASIGGSAGHAGAEM